MMTSKELSDCSDEASKVSEVLTRSENSKDETVTRGLFIVGGGLCMIAAVGYQIAAILRSRDEL